VIFLSALVVAIMFGAGAFLLLQRNLLRIVAGVILTSNAATLFIIASGLTRGEAPIHPLSGEAADPLAQALALTALVIGFAVAALLLLLVYRLYLAHHSIDMVTIMRTTRRQAALRRRGDDPALEAVPTDEPGGSPGEQP
jgi:multicomponent Na+:H+ antiporter subunit C